MDNVIIYYSENGHPLSYWGVPPKGEMIVAELYMKWYTLHIIKPDGTVEPLCYYEFEENPNLPKGISCESNHVPNPLAVQAYADWKGIQICTEGMELMIGRWAQEVRCKDPAPEALDELFT